jgi:hypothetical protein
MWLHYIRNSGLFPAVWTNQPLVKHVSPWCLPAIVRRVSWSSARTLNTAPTAEIYDLRFVTFSVQTRWLCQPLLSPPRSSLQESQPLLLFIAPRAEGLRGLATFPVRRLYQPDCSIYGARRCTVHALCLTAMQKTVSSSFSFLLFCMPVFHD